MRGKHQSFNFARSLSRINEILNSITIDIKNAPEITGTKQQYFFN